VFSLNNLGLEGDGRLTLPIGFMQKHCCLTLLPLVRLILLLVGCELYVFASPAESPTQRHVQQPRRGYCRRSAESAAPSPLTSVAVYEEGLCRISEGLHELMGNELADIAAVRAPVQRLGCWRSLWAMTSEGLLRLQHGGWKKVSGEAVNDLCEHLGEVSLPNRIACGA
jgi:hypothetical protein